MCIIGKMRASDGRRLGTCCRSALLVALVPLSLMAQRTNQAPTERAPRPPWNQRDTTEIFFEDAFAEALVGERPAHLQPETARKTLGSEQPTAASDGAAGAAAARWSAVVSAQTLQSQIKATIQRLQQSIRSPARFAGGDFQQAQRQFGHAATLFKVVAEYDAAIQWQTSAVAACQRAARAAAACQDGSAPTYAVAKQTRDELQELLNGSRLEPVDQATDWHEVADRRHWMRWIDAATNQRIKSAASANGGLAAQAETIIRDAEMLQLIAHILAQEDMDDGLDDDYRQLCDELASAARELEQATRNGKHQRAAAAVSRIRQSCAACHEAYRG